MSMSLCGKYSGRSGGPATVTGSSCLVSPIFRLLVVLLLLSAPACSRDRPDSSGAPSDEVGDPADQGGVAPWRAGEGLSLTPEPILSIGAVEGAPDYQFQDVRGAIRLPDGSIVVADRGAQHLQWYDASGRYLRTLGGRGEGPGEFRGLLSVFAHGDSVVAFDERLQRVSVFSPEGEFTRSFQIPTAPGLLKGVFRDGSSLLAFVLGEEVQAREEGYRRHVRATFHLGPQGEILDTLPPFPDREEILTIRPPAGGRSGGVALGPSPFGKETSFAAFGNRFAVGTQDRPEIQVFDADGTLRSTVRWQGGDRAVTGEVLEKHRDYQLGQADSPEARRRVHAWLDGEVYPDSLPSHKALFFDPSGNLWVEDYWFWGSGPARWQVFDPGGRQLGSVGFPDRFLVFEIGEDYVLGKGWDELEVEYVLMYGLVPGGG